MPLTAQQEWGRRLAQAGLANVRFRTKQAGDKMEIRNLGTESCAAVPGCGRVGSRRDPAGARRPFPRRRRGPAQTLAGRPGPQRSAGEPAGEDGLRAGGGPVPAGGKGSQSTGRLPYRRRQPPASGSPHPAAVVRAAPLDAGEAAGGRQGGRGVERPFLRDGLGLRLAADGPVPDPAGGTGRRGLPHCRPRSRARRSGPSAGRRRNARRTWCRE